MRCRECGSKRLLRGRAEVAKHLYENKSTQVDFVNFSEWLLAHTIPLKAASCLNNFHAFFKIVDESPHDWHLNAKILARLDKGLLRKDGYARLFYASQGKVIPSQVLENVSTWRAIQSHMNYLHTYPPHALFDEAIKYAAHCRNRYEQGDIKLRTLKQQLSATISLIKFLKRCNRELDQASVSEFLRHYPGLKASLSCFLIFIDGPSATVSSRKKGKNAASRSLLLGYLGQKDKKKPCIKIVRAALNYLHGIPHQLVKQVTMKQVYQLDHSVFEVRVGPYKYLIDFTLDI